MIEVACCYYRMCPKFAVDAGTTVRYTVIDPQNFYVKLLAKNGVPTACP
jgi:hypothetical protein